MQDVIVAGVEQGEIARPQHRVSGCVQVAAVWWVAG
jgi:hypothetical protein